MKKIATLLLIILGFIFAPLACASLKITAYHSGQDGTKILANAELFVELHLEKPAMTKYLFKKTDQNGMFEVSDLFGSFNMRANLIDQDGNILAGCFSPMGPVKAGQMTLKGIDCL